MRITFDTQVKTVTLVRIVALVSTLKSQSRLKAAHGTLELPVPDILFYRYPSNVDKLILVSICFEEDFPSEHDNV